jgi:hypothetical protein
LLGLDNSVRPGDLVQVITRSPGLGKTIYDTWRDGKRVI